MEGHLPLSNNMIGGQEKHGTETPTAKRLKTADVAEEDDFSESGGIVQLMDEIMVEIAHYLLPPEVYNLWPLPHEQTLPPTLHAAKLSRLCIGWGECTGCIARD